jgi:glyoxylase-like metal-dependent hydrolase (beta-lactamase superfamily II)
MTKTQVYAVGDARIARVEDCVIDSFPPERLLPEWREDDRRRLEQMSEAMAPDGRHVRLSVHSWVIQRQGKTIIVDTGAGADKPRPFARHFDQLKTPYLARLRDIGVSAADVDYVLHTHLHVDHVGWNTTLVDGRWRPTFANARHVFSAKEYAYFTDLEHCPATMAHILRRRNSWRRLAG